MARVVKIRSNSNILLNIATNFEDGSSSVKTVAVGDTVENLRYIENEEIKIVTGKVKDIIYSSVIANTSKPNPTDTFASDMKLVSVIIDASEEYASNVITVPTMEIIEDEGVENVTSVRVTPKLDVTIDIDYSNNTHELKDLEIGDILDSVVIMSGTPGTPDITGKYTVTSFLYTYTNKEFKVVGFNLVSEDGKNVKTTFDKIISFTEIPHTNIEGEGLSGLASLINDSESDEVVGILSGDTVVPDRDDGRITTVFVPEGKTVTLDLNGHNLDVPAYALYSTGGTIIIDDSTGKGTIKTRSHNTYGAVYTNGGTVIMNGGTIDTTTDTDDDPENPNYMYGIVAAGSGKVIINGGTIHTAEASGASITNGTAEGAGATFTFGGDAKLIADKNYAIYLADNKTVEVKDNAYVEGICARMGEIIVSDNAKIVNKITEEDVYDLGKFITESGVSPERAAILLMTGMYQSVGTESNDLNLVIKDNATVSSAVGEAVGVVKAQTKYNQTVNVTVDKDTQLTSAEGYDKIHIYEFEECAELVAAAGKTITKTSDVDLVVKVADEVVYPEPVPNEGEGEG